MSDASRRAYRRFASFFLITGGTFLLLGVLRATLLPDLLRGNPLPTALLLLAIGGGLRWTVRARPEDGDAPEPDPAALDPDADAHRIAPPPFDPGSKDDPRG